MGRRSGLFPDLGFLLLGIWLILEGLILLVNLKFAGLNTIMGLLALIAGALILLRGRI
ncbi:MAG TPA: hypothetical protein VF498_07190 [Anaerolineales bacterium]